MFDSTNLAARSFGLAGGIAGGFSGLVAVIQQIQNYFNNSSIDLYNAVLGGGLITLGGFLIYRSIAPFEYTIESHHTETPPERLLR